MHSYQALTLMFGLLLVLSQSQFGMDGRGKSMLNVQSISKKYRKTTVLNDVSFSVKRGEIVGLVGENGAGKSTLLRLLATLERPTNGNIVFDDMTYKNNVKSIRKQIGFVPQEIAVWDEFTVEENMVFFEKLAWKHKSLSELKQLCVDMELHKWQEKVHTLSGGMKRKLNLAISLIHDPAILLLDEPTVGIDLKSKQEIATYLKKLAHEQNKTIIYTSHDMDEIMLLCDYTYCLGSDPFYEEFLQARNQSIIVL